VRYQSDDFVPRADAQIALRLFAVHLSRIKPDHPYNLEGSCLVGVDLSRREPTGDKLSLRGVRLSQAKLLKVDFSNVDFTNAELMGVEAGDWHNDTWSNSPFRDHLHDKDDIKNYIHKVERRNDVANFSRTSFVNAKLQGAGFEGADFSNAQFRDADLTDANISRANFQGVHDLTEKQLTTACIGRSSDKYHSDNYYSDMPLPILPRGLESSASKLQLCPTAERGREIAIEKCDTCHLVNGIAPGGQPPSYQQIVWGGTSTREQISEKLAKLPQHIKLERGDLGDLVRYFQEAASIRR
jgi:hypothetical protein